MLQTTWRYVFESTLARRQWRRGVRSVCASALTAWTLAGQGWVQGETPAGGVSVDATVWSGESELFPQDVPIILPRWRSEERAAPLTERRAGTDVELPQSSPLWDWDRLPSRTNADSLTAIPANGDSVDSDSAPCRNRVARQPGEPGGRDGTDRSDQTTSDKGVPDKPLDSWAPALQVGEVAYDPTLFSPSPDYSGMPYSPDDEWGVYSGKFLNATERPWVELGRGLYLPGRTPQSQTCLGDHNLVAQHLLVYGDYRMGTAYIDSSGNDKIVSAARLNLDFDWKLTDTERIHGFWGPIDRGANFSRFEVDHGSVKFFDELDPNWDTIYFEGDVGSLLAGHHGHDSNFDLPFAAGLMPLLFQNGTWMEDAFVGAAFTLTARHNRHLHWSNYDVTFFTGLDKLNSPAFGTDDSAANVYGVTTFIEAYDGYLELGYAYLDDTRGLGRSYHNLAASFTRRYWHRVSNSIRMIVNAGQDPVTGPRTADGCLVLFENALITAKPNTVVPYVNAFVGFGRPQSVARAAVAGGILRNTGILFETDGLTGFPLLDDTGSNTYGGAVGLNWLADDFSHQVVLELATVQTFGLQAGRKAVDDQYGVGARYQKPLNQAWILRMDALYGLLENADNLTGGRVELRYKF